MMSGLKEMKKESLVRSLSLPHLNKSLVTLEKCLLAGYPKIILCLQERKTLEKAKAFMSKELSDSELEKVTFLLPDEVLFFFEEEAAGRAGKEERVKGYKVKVNYQPMQEDDKKSKRQAIAQVILKSLRRD